MTITVYAQPVETAPLVTCKVCLGEHRLRHVEDGEGYCTGCGALNEIRSKPRPSDRRAQELAPILDDIDTVETVHIILGLASPWQPISSTQDDDAPTGYCQRCRTEVSLYPSGHCRICGCFVRNPY